MNENLKKNHNVIITIVKKGKAKKICDIAKKAGAEGGTTILGKGTSVKEFKKIFGLTLDDDREVVLTVVNDKIEDEVFDAIVEKGELNKPGNGIVFVMDLKKIDGIVHLLKGVEG
ncbi:P-II family nitrogen regulator [Natranaerofaba carboxydovora]|uniref:P-II family nitrogen regulator n=1 Tax=Natranaerofaba carboxydovora TaxID=2742683 RepID=UPI001F12F9EB|nr:P-II family nitrogen regulator [Natranaerofaba carboxydovora]UMZ74056.1 hypothetical protein ACONDI_01629 [Natranaerofaba carboxydovora]